MRDKCEHPKQQQRKVYQFNPLTGRHDIPIICCFKCSTYWKEKGLATIEVIIATAILLMMVGYFWVAIHFIIKLW